MHIIFLLIFLFILYKFTKKYFTNILIISSIIGALIYFPEITISIISLIIIVITWNNFAEKQKLKKDCMQLLKNNDSDEFIEKYESYSIKEKKIIINIITKEFNNSKIILIELFYSDFFDFYSAQGDDNDNEIIFEKNECLDNLSPIWGERTSVFLNELISDNELNIEEFTITGDNKKKTTLIKVKYENKENDEENESNDLFSNAISLD